jgi:uncharacterized protein HemX
MGRRVVVLLAVVLMAAGPSPRAAAQEPDATSTTPSIQVPTQDIVPEPNSGRAPSEAGDRGGVLQVGLLLLVVAAVAGAVVALVRQSRRARGLDGGAG